MNRKYFLFILQFLTSICIVSVGFASWTIISGVSIKESGTISAEDVHSNDKYIEYVSHDVFRYYDTGFVSGSGESAQISLSGTLKYSYVLHLDTLKEDLEGQTTLIKFTLTHPVIEDFTIISSFNNYASVKLDDTDISTRRNEVTDNARYIEIPFEELKNARDGSIITIEYTFTAQSIDEFKISIYPCFIEARFQFLNKVDVLFVDGE